MCEDCQFRPFYYTPTRENIALRLFCVHTVTSTMAIYRVGLLFISGLLALERTTPLRIVSDDVARTAAVYTGRNNTVMLKITAV